MFKFVTLSLILVVSAVSASAANRDTIDTTPDDSQALSRTIPDVPFLIFKIIKALIGAKLTTVGLGVVAIEWIVANSVIILIGVAAALGLCKITGKCSLSYEEYVPVAQLKSFVTPENLQTAEEYFVSAMEKYAEKRSQAISGTGHRSY